MQRPTEKSLHSSLDSEMIEPKSTDLDIPEVAHSPSITPLHAAIPDGSDEGSTEAPMFNAKFVIRTKTPSFPSDGDVRPEVYYGKSVSLNSDKGWELDVKRNNKVIDRSSRPSCFNDASLNGSNPTFGLVSIPGLQVSDSGSRDSHLGSASGNGGLANNAIRKNNNGGLGTADYLDQDELTERMLGPQQQALVAENYLKSMQEARRKNLDDRKEAENRTAVVEALLRASLGLRANERSESILMQKFLKAEEDLGVCQALLEKSRERAVASEQRALRAEILVQRMAEKNTGSITTLLHETQREAKKYQDLYKEATKRAERAEQRLERAEALQEEDRKWTVDAEERAVTAEEKAYEITVKFFDAERQIDDLNVKLMKAEAQAENSEKDFKEAKSGLEALEQRVQVSEEGARLVKEKFKGLHQKYAKLLQHHNDREAEYMARNEEWKVREEEYAAKSVEWKQWVDEVIAKGKYDLLRLEEEIGELSHDKNLIISTFMIAMNKMRREGKIIDEDELENLIAWAKKPPSMKKGKEVAASVTVGREKARRKLEGNIFTPSLNAAETAAFEGSGLEELGLDGKGPPKPLVTVRKNSQR